VAQRFTQCRIGAKRFHDLLRILFLLLPQLLDQSFGLRPQGCGWAERLVRASRGQGAGSSRQGSGPLAVLSVSIR
jgi:hypothetical protein